MAGYLSVYSMHVWAFNTTDMCNLLPFHLPRYKVSPIPITVGIKKTYHHFIHDISFFVLFSTFLMGMFSVLSQTLT